MYGAFYDRHYSRLTGYGLWLRGEELNRLDADVAGSARFRVLFARLSTYADTADSFTHPLLYAIAAGIEGVYPDLAFLPPPKDGALMEKEGVPWLLGTQSKRGPAGFDLIGFSNSIAQELVNLPVLLARSGIPWSKTERLTRADVPLLILGGANAAFTTVLQGAAAESTLVDGIFHGEDPEEIGRLLAVCRDGKMRGASKRETLEALEALPGFFQPDQPRPTRKSHWHPDQYVSRLARMPLLYGESLEGNWPLSEGCPAFCSFCAESWARKPYRETGLDSLKKHALAYKASVGLEGLAFYSFNFNMHSELYSILRETAAWFGGLSLKSQRFDWLAKTPELPAILRLLGKSTMTCGLEGISPRLRRFLQKSLDEDSLWRSLESMASARLRELKIFLIATGREEEQDYQAYVEFLGRLQALLTRTGQAPRVILSITPLVRFPWTPLEFETAPPPEAIEAVLKRIEHLSRRQGFEARRAADTSEYLLSQILLRADRPEILAALIEAGQATGFVYYREVSRDFMGAFLAALAGRGLALEALLAGFNLEANKPWARHETGVRREFLWEQYQKAARLEEDAYCLGHHGKTAVCLACGACPDSDSRVRLTRARQERPFALKAFAERLQSLRKSVFTMDYRVRASAPARGAPRLFLGGKLAAALMRAEPGLAPFYRRCLSSQIAPKLDYCWMAGDDVLTLEWREPALSLLEALWRRPGVGGQISQFMKPWGEFQGVATGNAVVRALVFSSPYPCRMEVWLKKHGLKCTLRRVAADRLACEFTRDSLKKRIVTGLELTEQTGPNGEGCQVSVTPGVKFDPEGFARSAFVLPSAEDWVRIVTEVRMG